MNQYLITGTDYTDEQALERRMATRPAHLEGVKVLKEKGQYILGGAMLNPQGQMVGSTMVLQFATEPELQQWLAQEPYVQGNVWEHIDVKPFKVAQV